MVLPEDFLEPSEPTLISPAAGQLDQGINAPGSSLQPRIPVPSALKWHHSLVLEFPQQN